MEDFTRLTGGERMMYTASLHMSRHWCKYLIVLALIVAVIVIVRLLEGFTISDAYGRNVGWGTPLDFDVIRPEGMQNLPGAGAALAKN